MAGQGTLTEIRADFDEWQRNDRAPTAPGPGQNGQPFKGELQAACPGMFLHAPATHAWMRMAWPYRSHRPPSPRADKSCGGARRGAADRDVTLCEPGEVAGSFTEIVIAGLKPNVQDQLRGLKERVQLAREVRRTGSRRVRQAGS
jgi:hypothetical protein